MIGSFPRGFPSFCVTPETRRGKHLPESNANHSNSFHQSLHREGIAHGIRVITYRTTSRTAFVAGNRSTFGTFLQVIHYSPAVRTSSITNKLFFLSLIFWFLVSHLRLLSEGISLILFLSETRRGDSLPESDANHSNHQALAIKKRIPITTISQIRRKSGPLSSLTREASSSASLFCSFRASRQLGQYFDVPPNSRKQRSSPIKPQDAPNLGNLDLHLAHFFPRTGPSLSKKAIFSPFFYRLFLCLLLPESFRQYNNGIWSVNHFSKKNEKKREKS